MLEAMQATFHALQALYQAGEALYNAGPAVMNGSAIALTVFLGVVFLRGRSR